jgi:hypothetical protein
LNVILEDYQRILLEKDDLNKRIEKLEEEKLQLLAEVRQQKDNKLLMHITMKEMQKDIDLYITESKKQAREIDQLKRAKDELRAMYHEENRKILFDSQFYKDKVDQLKTDLHDLKKLYKETLDYKQLYEDLKIREDERQA